MKYSIKVNEVGNRDGNIRAFANVVFGDSFKITNIAILENREKNELFVSMPRYKTNERNEDGGTVYKDVCNPITAEFRAEFYGNILEAYETEKNQDTQQGRVGDERLEMPEFSVTVTPYEKEGSNIRGLARIYFEDSFIVNNVSILQGKNSLFVAMPSYKTSQIDENGKPIYQDVCFPITKEFREKLYGDIIETYEREMKKRQEQSQQPGRPLNRREQYQMAHRDERPFR